MLTTLNIINKFLDAPSYIDKKGTDYLANLWGTTSEIVDKARSEVKKRLQEEEGILPTNKEVDLDYLERTSNVDLENGTITSSGVSKEEIQNPESFYTFFKVDPKKYTINSFWSKSHKSGGFTYSVRFVKKQEEVTPIDALSILKSYQPNKITKKDYIYNLPASEEKLAVFCLFDLHLGKQFNGIKVETLEEQKKLYLDCVKDLLEKVHNIGYEKVLLPIGQDYFNCETTKTTTKGTPQDNYWSSQEMFRYGLEILIETINYIQEYSAVDVILVKGNHASNLESILATSLKAFFANSERVNIDDSPFPRKYYQYGVNGIMFDHGELTAQKYFELFTYRRKRNLLQDKVSRSIIRSLSPRDCKRSKWNKSKMVRFIKS